MRSPSLDVSEKRITPPVFITQHKTEGEIPEHQFCFFAGDQMKTDQLKEELFSFGESLKRQIENSPFHWKGFGTLHFDSDEMHFEPDEIHLDSLQALPAERVLRNNVQHSVLVGDQEMTSQQVTEALNQPEYKQPWFMLAGWILLIASIIAILIYLYVKNFQTTSTGLGTW